ncbi:hypothetical protein [Shayang ascaridia galli virus 2]|uniref:Uncharacterized protein n=1 Tax=Shayang ascaridia galli virus 2 TaxID=1923460 RepID=A0A1L3KN16_9RHAB|nr:hypothetical protein [Shayang ascaridia galli virus 2]APG78778.1 hypothetical protein [Shayang ascaridia galli virus 2]
MTTYLVMNMSGVIDVSVAPPADKQETVDIACQMVMAAITPPIPTELRAAAARILCNKLDECRPLQSTVITSNGKVPGLRYPVLLDGKFAVKLKADRPTRDFVSLHCPQRLDNEDDNNNSLFIHLTLSAELGIINGVTANQLTITGRHIVPYLGNDERFEAIAAASIKKKSDTPKSPIRRFAALFKKKNHN